MNDNFTFAELRPNAYLIGFVLIIAAAILFLSGCSSGMEHSSLNQTGITGDKSFSFNDAGSEWQVNFQDNEISSLYKNGVRIPDEEIDNHKKMIYKNLGDLSKEYEHLSSKVFKYNFDADKLDKEMKKFKDDFDKEKFMHFKFEFDEDQLKENMEHLEKQLEKLKDRKIELYFDSDNFNDKMKKLEEELKDLPEPPSPPDIDVDVYMDMDNLKDGIIKLKESFKHFDVKIDTAEFDMNELKNNMLELKKNLKGLKIEVHDVKSGAKKLSAFLDELKPELVKDGYLQSESAEYDLEMNAAITKVNDRVVKPEDHKKYSDLYKKHFDKELDGTIKIKKD